MALTQKKLLLGCVSLVAVGGVGAWWWMSRSKEKKEPNEPPNVNLLRKPNRAKKAISAVEPPSTIKQEPEEDPKDIQEPQQVIEEPDDEVQDLDTEESVVIDDPKKKIVEAGLNCEDATRETDCTVLTEGLNVDIDGNKRENYEFSDDGENGRFKFRISNDPIFGDSFRFIVTENPIKLKDKTDSSQTITLERYENYGLVKDSESEKVYLTRKLTANQGKIRSLGLPDSCTLPTEVSSETLKAPTCKLSTNQIKSVNFEGKKNEGATTTKNVELYIQKVSDETTYKGGYKFTFHPEADVEISKDDKIMGGVWKDFKLKDPDADDLVLEKVWKGEGGLLSKVGLTCEENGRCTINDGALKIRDDRKSIENGKKKGGSGTIYLENKNAAGYYEGLMFSVWGGEITIENSTSTGSTIKMEELGIYHIIKEEKGGSSSYYLTRKPGGVEEMITNYLGVNNCSPRAGFEKSCSGVESHLRNFKFYDGEGEKRITINTGNPPVSITVTPNQNKRIYPLGYKYSINPAKEIKMGKITLKAKTNNTFKIKRDESVKKLYLEIVKG